VPCTTSSGRAVSADSERDGHPGFARESREKTKAEGTANDDPRPSLEERYPTHEAYVNAMHTAAKELKVQRLLLDEDVQGYVPRAEASQVER
jgi:Alpha/beta hydrolase domain